MVLDAHKMALGPKGETVFNGMLAATLYGNYYFWHLTPFAPLYFGLTCFSTFVMSIAALNASMSNSSFVVEIVVL